MASVREGDVSRLVSLWVRASKTEKRSVSLEPVHDAACAGNGCKRGLIVLDGIGTGDPNPDAPSLVGWLRKQTATLGTRQYCCWFYNYAPEQNNELGRASYAPADTVANMDLRAHVDALGEMVGRVDGPVAFAAWSLGGIILSDWLRGVPETKHPILGAALLTVPWSLLDTRPIVGLEYPGLPDRITKRQDAASKLARVLLSLPDGLPDVKWVEPTLIVTCQGDTDGLLAAQAYSGNWRHSNVEIVALQNSSHLGAPEAAAGTIARWLAQI